MENELEVCIEEGKEENADDDSIYSEKVRDQLLDDDELTAAEEGFMVGYLEA
jgi:osmotically-inducible protein OsmY